MALDGTNRMAAYNLVRSEEGFVESEKMLALLQHYNTVIKQPPFGAQTTWNLARIIDYQVGFILQWCRQGYVVFFDL